MTELEIAREGKLSDRAKEVALDESLDTALLIELIALGYVVIPSNKKRGNIKSVGIGKNLKTKINANIGTSPITLAKKRS